MFREVIEMLFLKRISGRLDDQNLYIGLTLSNCLQKIAADGIYGHSVSPAVKISIITPINEIYR